jgi:uncharacterized protein (DUF2141 family)
MILRIFTCLYIILVLHSCANIKPLGGGPKDIEPPKLIKEKSTPNETVNFNPKNPIIITFDEWIKLENPYQNIIISPTLKVKPNIKLSGKSIEIIFDEKDTLKHNTTYSINFGTTIRDLHEDNILQNMKFVFSTGTLIDSLKCTGSLVDANTQKPMEDAVFMLYLTNEDSIVYKEKPFYFAKTDKLGNFEITNIKEGKYKVMALKDLNSNYQYDNEKENIAYLDTILSITQNVNIGKMELFEPELDYRIKESSFGKGFANFLFTNNPKYVKYKVLGKNTIPTIDYIINDTLKIIYNDVDTSLTKVYFQFPDGNKDTLILEKDGRKQMIKSLKIENPLSNSVAINYNRTNNQGFLFNLPITSVNNEKILINKDSITIPNKWKWKLDSIDSRKIYFTGEAMAEKTYNVILLPGAITSFFGNNEDTFNVSIRIINENTLGNIKLDITDLDSTKSYILELKSNDEGIVYLEKISKNNRFDATVFGLKPDIYDMQIIEDTNSNGKYDSGNYWKHTKPERIFTKKLEQLRANWDLEVNFSIKNEN